MGGGIPKQFRDWGGVPLLKATVQAFLAPDMPRLRGIALAVPGDRIGGGAVLVLRPPLLGGVRRGDPPGSVAAALASLPGDPDAPVMIHDGVRPFPPAGPVREALDALAFFDGSLLGEPSTDTLKRVDREGLVLGTEPRETIYRAQTPQIALLSIWQKAFLHARNAGITGTDDVSLLELLGLRVKLVVSPSSNLKLTVPEDWKPPV